MHSTQDASQCKNNRRPLIAQGILRVPRNSLNFGLQPQQMAFSTYFDPTGGAPSTFTSITNSNRIPFSNASIQFDIEPNNASFVTSESGNYFQDFKVPQNGPIVPVQAVPIQALTRSKVNITVNDSPIVSEPKTLIDSLIPDQTSFDFFAASSQQQSKETLTLQLEHIIQSALEEVSNERSDSNLITNAYSSLNPRVLDIMGQFCRKLGVNLATVFASIELYDRFVVQFAFEMKDTLKTMRGKDLVEIRQRAHHLVPLRIATCILLASKLHTDASTPEVTLEKIRILMKEYDYSYTKVSIIKSEKRVFNTLEFRLSWPSPYEIVEQIIAILELDNETRTKTYRHSMNILFLAYEYHHNLYDSLWDILHIENPPFKGMRKKGMGRENNVGTSNDWNVKIERARLEFKRKIEMNVVLRSGGIVATALMLINPETSGNSTRDFSREIANLISTEVVHIFDISIAIFSLVTSPENKRFFR